MRLILANQATAAKRRVYFHLVDATDGMTPETGEATGQPQISTNGGAWTDTGIGTLSAIGNGRYYADLTQSAVVNAGDVIETRYKSAATAECPGDSVQVVAFDPDNATSLGLANLNAAVGTRSSHSAADAADAVLDEAKGAHSGHLAQSFALASVCTEDRLAELDASNMPADLDSALADTNELQTDDVPGLIAALNNLSSEEAQAAANAALIALGLDHLVSTSVAGDDVADNSIVAKIVSKNATADWDSFANTTDALEALRDYVFSVSGALTTLITTANNHLAGIKGTGWVQDTHSLPQCVTATGFSTHSAADVKTAIEADGSKVDHLWEMTEDDGGTRRFAAGAFDGVFLLDMDQVESSAPEHSLCTIVLAILESAISGSTWTIKRTDGATTHATKTVTTDENADPITGVA